MNIIIQERAFVLTSQYDIYAGDETYFAKKPFFSFSKKLELSKQENGPVMAKINSRSFWGFEFDFEFADGQTSNFWREKLWKGVYVCDVGEMTLRLYQHKGLRYSIFQGERQIAAVTKNRFVFGNGNKYELQVNSDVNRVVIICMVLALNTANDDDDNATITVDLGSIGPEERPFDETWEPN